MTDSIGYVCMCLTVYFAFCVSLFISFVLCFCERTMSVAIHLSFDNRPGDIPHFIYPKILADAILNSLKFTITKSTTCEYFIQSNCAISDITPPCVSVYWEVFLNKLLLHSGPPFISRYVKCCVFFISLVFCARHSLLILLKTECDAIKQCVSFVIAARDTQHWLCCCGAVGEITADYTGKLFVLM